jgi:hypothetical protein
MPSRKAIGILNPDSGIGVKAFRRRELRESRAMRVVHHCWRCMISWLWVLSSVTWNNLWDWWMVQWDLWIFVPIYRIEKGIFESDAMTTCFCDSCHATDFSEIDSPELAVFRFNEISWGGKGWSPGKVQIENEEGDEKKIISGLFRELRKRPRAETENPSFKSDKMDAKSCFHKSDNIFSRRKPKRGTKCSVSKPEIRRDLTLHNFRRLKSRLFLARSSGENFHHGLCLQHIYI